MPLRLANPPLCILVEFLLPSLRMPAVALTSPFSPAALQMVDSFNLISKQCSVPGLVPNTHAWCPLVRFHVAVIAPSFSAAAWLESSFLDA